MEIIYSLLVIAISVVVCSSQPLPSPPVISETFSTKFRGESKKGDHLETIFLGETISDYSTKKTLTYIIKSEADKIKLKSHSWSLDRYDTHESHSFEWEGEDQEPHGECRIHTISGNIQPVWAWTRNMAYNKTIDFENHRIDVFNGMDGDIEVSIGVAQDEKNIPYFTTHRFEESFAIYYYHDFVPNVPNQSVFDVPKECHRHEEH